MEIKTSYRELFEKALSQYKKLMNIIKDGLYTGNLNNVTEVESFFQFQNDEFIICEKSGARKFAYYENFTVATMFVTNYGRMLSWQQHPLGSFKDDKLKRPNYIFQFYNKNKKLSDEFIELIRECNVNNVEDVLDLF